MERKIHELIDNCREDYIRMLQSWIRIPSVKGEAAPGARPAARREPSCRPAGIVIPADLLITIKLFLNVLIDLFQSRGRNGF